jgi:hypothetical protein
MKKFDLSLLTLAILILAAVLLGINTHSGEANETIAVINGEAVTKEEFYLKLKERYGDKMLDRITMETLINQEARKNGITVTDEELNQKFAEYKQFIGEKKFKQLIESGNTTEAQLKAQLGQKMLISKLEEKLFTASEEEMKQYFEKNRSDFKKATSYEQVKDDIRAEIVAEKLSEWEDSLLENAKIEIIDPSLAKDEEEKKEEK